MDIPVDFKSDTMIFRQKGLLCCAVSKELWPEQPELFMWKPDSMFFSAWVPDPFFSILQQEPGITEGWKRLRYDLDKWLQFVYPLPEQAPQPELWIQNEMWEDLKSRHSRVYDWVMEEAMPDIKAAWFSRQDGGSGGRARSQRQQTDSTGSSA